MIKEGILNFNKPAGITSNDCIYRLRRATGIRKIGHTGTLDPMAEGVLPLCIGSASRITEYLDLDFKSYRCTMLLGIETDSMDTQGEILIDKRAEIIKSFSDGNAFSIEQIRDAFFDMKGYIQQYPPKYSAVRVAGRRLYDYARAGEEVEIKPRRVYIKSIDIVGFDADNLKITFDVTCSKGTYIRTICHDAGRKLGCGGAMCALTRTATGRFSIDNAVSEEELADIAKLSGEEREKAINRLLVMPDYPLIHFGKATVSYETGRRFCDGWHLPLKETKITQEPEFKNYSGEPDIRPEYREAYNIYMMQQDCEEVFLGVAFYNHKYKKLVADKVFYKGFLKNGSVEQK